MEHKDIRTAIDLASRVYDTGTDVDDLRYLIHEQDGKVFVSIRGTSNGRNWLRDLACYPRKSPGGRWVHSGVVRAFEKLAAVPEIKEVMQLPGEQVVYCGHSLGGGICMPFIEAHPKSIAVTIGAMRVYWRWGKMPETNHIRIAATGDPVPRRLWPIYRHVHMGLVLPDNNGWPEISDHAAKAYQTAWSKHQEETQWLAFSQP